MWLTHSKNASRPVRALAASLAARLPSCRLITRSKRPLARLEALAARGGVGTLLVLLEYDEGKTKGKRSSVQKDEASSIHSILRTRRQSHESEGRVKWVWDEKELVLHHVEFGPKSQAALASDTPVVFKARAKEAQSVLSFLGFEDDGLASLYDKPQAVNISARKGLCSLKAGKTMLVQFNYSWGKTW